MNSSSLAGAVDADTTEPVVGAGAASLDESQRAAVDLPDGVSCAVIGAPGTGKTSTLIELVADRILLRGYTPSEVLVLVPTRTAATTLRDRLGLRLGIPTNGPLARSANSVAFQIVRGAEAAAGGPAPTLLTGGEQDQIIAELLQGHLDDQSDGAGRTAPDAPAWPDVLGADVRRLRGFRTELRDLMMRAVEYGITPDELARLGRTTERPEWVAAADFIREYADVKDQTRAGQYDSTELARYAAAVVARAPSGLAGAEVLGTLAGIRLIVLDDAQEVTQATLGLLAQFVARGVSVIAFGDPDITTGSFHGAHPDALGRLGAYLNPVPGSRPEADRVRVGPALILSTVYRHGAAIRAVVREITHRIGTAAAGTQRAAASAAGGATPIRTADTVSAVEPNAGSVAVADSMEAPDDRVHTVVVDSPAEQLAVIARRLRERHVMGGIPWGRMAVIVRSGSLVPALSRGLAALEVPTQVSTAQTALRDDYAVRAFILALEVTLGRKPLGSEAATELLRGPLGGLDPITLRRLRAALRQQELSHPEPPSSGGYRSSDELLAAVFTTTGLLAGIDNRTARRAASCAESLRQAAVEHAAGATIEELLWGLWQRSGLAREWKEQSTGTGIVADEANHNLDAVVALFSAAQRYVERTPGAPPVLFLEHLVDTDVPEDTLAPRALGDAVTVSTPSGTINRDFDVVVLAGVQQNVWPDLRIRGSLLGAGDLAALASGGSLPASDARLDVLHDELRMFAQAASRARTELLVTCISNEEYEPSVFLRLLPVPDEPAADPDDASRYPLSLRGLAGRLRADLTRAHLARPGSPAATRAADAAAT
ncbi:ATP-dependent helicase, partial [Cryobacterium sp. MLB-32]|uniref:ATP-dependent helicase n=1 Tax=Cryobacterium sp. MLB-32 TaxID=1529318 RepID=UPI0012E076F8